MASSAPHCPHRPPCPGCPNFFQPGYPTSAAASLAELAATAGLRLPPLVEGPPRKFRLRARLAVRGRSASPKIGIFQADSHRIVDIPNCEVHHPLINRVCRAVKQAVRKTGVKPYAEGPHLGDLRGIQVVVERASQRAQVVLIGKGIVPGPLQELATELESELGDELHSLWWNGNAERGNVILGPLWQRFFGPDALEESIGGAKVYFPPGAFSQSNLDLADRIVARIGEWVPDGARVAEFYAGCGAIGLGLVARSQRVDFNEVGEASLAGLARGLSALPPFLHSRAEIYPGKADELHRLVRNATVVIADPPRKGLDPKLLDALVDAPPSRFIYLSCGLDSFTRDSNRLSANGRMTLKRLESFALFRHSDHVETLALFEPDRSQESERS